MRFEGGCERKEKKLTVAFPHHDTTHSDEGRGGETPLFRTEKTRNGDIASGTNLTVCLDSHTSTQIIQNERLMRLGQTKFPGKTGVLDTYPPRSTGATIVARNEDMIRLRLCHTTGDDANTHLRDELHRNASARIGAFKVIDELLQILDGVDVVVRGRRDETHASSGMPGACDGERNLMARKFTALSRFRALSHLDLQLVGIGKVVGGDTESTRGDLLDSRSHGVSVGED